MGKRFIKVIEKRKGAIYMRIKLIHFFLKVMTIIFLFQLIVAPNVSLAEDAEKKTSIGEIVSQGDSFVSKGKILIDQDKLNASQSQIFNILLAIGIVLTVIVGGYLGIKLMMASAEDKAKIKEMMIPYVLGCVVIYGAFGIWKIVITVLDQIA